MFGFRPQEMIFMVVPLFFAVVGLLINGLVVYYAVRLALRHERNSK